MSQPRNVLQCSHDHLTIARRIVSDRLQMEAKRLIRAVGCLVFSVFFDLDLSDPGATFGLCPHHGGKYFVNVQSQTLA